MLGLRSDRISKLRNRTVYKQNNTNERKKHAAYLPLDSELALFMDDYIIAGEGYTYMAKTILMDILIKITHAVYFNTHADSPNSDIVIHFINLIRKDSKGMNNIDILESDTIGDIIRKVGVDELTSEEASDLVVFGKRLDKIISSLLNTIIENYDVSNLLSSRCISCTNSYFVLCDC